MQVLLALLLFVTAALGAPNYVSGIFNYHEEIGIPKAALIKASEEASDFDGSRITGGSLARVGQFPHMGGLIIILSDGRQSVCGSSLLSNTRLLTAAHCWLEGRQTARQLTVVLGSIRLFHGGVRINTNRVAAHANYNPQTFQNDIAVITINWVNFNNDIRPINLPSGSPTYVGQTARAAGFGITGDNHAITQNQALAWVDLPVITNAQCRNVFGNMVFDSTLCTWGPAGRNTCRSDSGGPLAIGNTLIGVTSFGDFRCQSNSPSAFARVTSFVSWIRQRL